MKIALIRFAEIEHKRRRADYSDGIDNIFPVVSNASEPQENNTVVLQKLDEVLTSQPKDDEPAILLPKRFIPTGCYQV